MQQISFILIFIAHQTIMDATKEIQSNSEHEITQDDLATVFKQYVPSMALKQIGEITLLLLDKIFRIPNEWIKALTPLIIWLTLHKEDRLIENLFDNNPVVSQELSRLH